MNLYGRQFCDSDSTKQSKKASEGAEQAVMIQYKYRMGTYDSTAETIYHVDTRRTQQYRHSGDADNTLNLVTRKSA